MFRCLFIITACFSNTVFAQDVNHESYKVYSALIKSKTRDSAKTNVVLKKLVTDTLDFYEIKSILNIIKADKEVPYFFEHSFLTNLEFSSKEVDSLTRQQILNFYSVAYNGGMLKNLFDSSTKIILVNKLPDASGKNFYYRIIRRWKRFYKKYPQTGLVFRFSKVYYPEDDKTAIFMYAYGGEKFMGSIALAVMKRYEDNWFIKYEIDLRNQED